MAGPTFFLPQYYVYIPLGGSRCSKPRTYWNIFVTFLVSGIWHGASWTFFAWGAYHAVLFLPLILLGKNRKYKEVVASDRLLPNVRDTFQKSAVGRGLKDCTDEDIIIFSDLDEIPNPVKVREILDNFDDSKIYHF